MGSPLKCDAKSKRHPGRCGANAMLGRTKCYHHGGASTGGPIKHGRYSKALGRFAEAYEESRADASLLELREPLAVIDAMAKRLMSRVAEGDTPGLRRRAVKLASAAAKAQSEDQPLVAEAKLAELERLLREGVEEDRSARLLVDTCYRLARRVEGANHIQLQRKNVVNGRELLAVLKRFMDVVFVHVTDELLRGRIAHDIDINVLGGARQRALPEIASGEERRVPA